MAFDPVRSSAPVRDGVQPAPAPRASPGSSHDRAQTAQTSGEARAQQSAALSDARAVVGVQRSEQPAADADTIRKAVEELNQTLEALSVGTRFTFDESAEEMQVVVENRMTGEVIRKIPPDEVLARRANLERLAGLLFDANA
jgi:flagellar protein FlaG